MIAVSQPFLCTLQILRYFVHKKYLSTSLTRDTTSNLYPWQFDKTVEQVRKGKNNNSNPYPVEKIDDGIFPYRNVRKDDSKKGEEQGEMPDINGIG